MYPYEHYQVNNLASEEAVKIMSSFFLLRARNIRRFVLAFYKLLHLSPHSLIHYRLVFLSYRYKSIFKLGIHSTQGQATPPRHGITRKRKIQTREALGNWQQGTQREKSLLILDLLKSFISLVIRKHSTDDFHSQLGDKENCGHTHPRNT